MTDTSKSALHTAIRVAFVSMAAASASGLVSPPIALALGLALALTLFLIGSGLSRDALKAVGFRPMVQGVILWVIVATAGYGAVRFLVP